MPMSCSPLGGAGLALRLAVVVVVVAAAVVAAPFPARRLEEALLFDLEGEAATTSSGGPPAKTLPPLPTSEEVRRAFSSMTRSSCLVSALFCEVISLNFRSKSTRLADAKTRLLAAERRLAARRCSRLYSLEPGGPAAGSAPLYLMTTIWPSAIISSDTRGPPVPRSPSKSSPFAAIVNKTRRKKG
jgi:hypothetical protein